jgi:Polyketide cyclase / dehydrase and lipid transport
MAKVSVSTKLAAPADKVWSVIGGWNTVPDWHPAVGARLSRGIL